MTIVAVTVAWVVAVTACTVTGWPLATYRDGDFFAFWAGSRSIVEGHDPYDLSWWIAVHTREGSAELTFLWPPSGPRWPSVYPLWTDLVFVPLAILPIGVAAAAWLVSQTFAVLTLIVVLWRRIVARPRGSLALMLAIVVGSYPFWLLIAGGNMTGWLFAIYWGAVALVLANRPTRAGAVLGLLLLKPQAFLIAVPMLLGAIRTDRRRAVLAGMGVGAVLLGAATLVRPTWIGAWLSSVAIARSVPLSNATLWTLDRIAGPAGGVPFIGPVAVVALLVGGSLWIATRRPRAVWLVCASTAVSVAVAPYGWSYDELLLVPLALPIIAVASARRPAVRVSLVLATVAVLDVLPWILHAAALRSGGEELSALVPVLAFALIVITESLPRAGDLRGV